MKDMFREPLQNLFILLFTGKRVDALLFLNGLSVWRSGGESLVTTEHDSVEKRLVFLSPLQNNKYTTIHGDTQQQIVDPSATARRL